MDVLSRLTELEDNIAKVYGNIFGIACGVMEEHEGEMTDRVRELLMQGLGADNNPLYPTYYADQYFKDAEAAERYVLWKEKHAAPQYRAMPVTGSPNLAVFGNFHQGLRYYREGNELVLTSDYEGEAIMEHYGFNIGTDAEWMHREIHPLIEEEIINTILS